MGYGVKWVEDNLGISRKALRIFEEKGLMPKNGSRNPRTNYRDYSTDDINQIWLIKTLQGIGFTLTEIKKMKDNPDTDTYAAISEKVVELEQKRKEIDQLIGLAKTIKTTGRIPSITEVGTMRFEDYIDHINKTWNFENNPTISPLLSPIESYMRISEKMETTDADISIEQAEALMEQAESIMERMKNIMTSMNLTTVAACETVLGELSGYDYKSEIVQAVVRLHYESFLRDSPINHKENYSIKRHVQWFASYYLPGSDIYQGLVLKLGPETCRFIAKAFAFFGGYETLDDFMEEGENVVALC